MNVRKLTLLTVILLLSVVLTGGILTTAQTEEPIDLQKGLVAYWSFDEGEGDIVFDESGNHNDGVLKCAGEDCSPPKWVKGKIGYALEFDGEDDYVEVLDSNRLNIGSGDFTIVFWLKEFEKPGGVALYDQEASENWRGYRVDAANKGKIQLLCREGGVNYIVRTRKLFTNENFHFVTLLVSRGRKQMDTYFDGAEVGYERKDGLEGLGDISNKANLYIGSALGRANWLHGTLDEIRVYNRLLSRDEINTLTKS